MVFPTATDNQAAQWLSADPTRLTEVHDACAFVILAFSYGWEVDAEALGIVRDAARTLPDEPSDRLLTLLGPSDPGCDPASNDR